MVVLCRFFLFFLLRYFSFFFFFFDAHVLKTDYRKKRKTSGHRTKPCGPERKFETLFAALKTLRADLPQSRARDRAAARRSRRRTLAARTPPTLLGEPCRTSRRRRGDRPTSGRRCTTNDHTLRGQRFCRFSHPPRRAAPWFYYY